MADVQLIRWTLVLVAAAKAADVAVRDDPTRYGWGWAAAAALAAVTVRPGCFAVAAMGAASNIWLEGSNHTLLIMWVGLIVAVLDPDDIPPVAQVLAATVYVFASAHKVIGGSFLTGGHIADRFFWDGAPVQAMAYAAVASQIGLAVLVVLRSRWAIPLAVGLHVGIVVVMSNQLGHYLRLSGFNGLMIVIVLVATRAGTWDVRPRRRVASVAAPAV
ncbi:MAG TPA: hypothetical protein VGE43_09620 [Acidimicrobiales bacterium]|jgi:hypothetical protein